MRLSISSEHIDGTGRPFFSLVVLFDFLQGKVDSIVDFASRCSNKVDRGESVWMQLRIDTNERGVRQPLFGGQRNLVDVFTFIEVPKSF